MYSPVTIYTYLNKSYSHNVQKCQDSEPNINLCRTAKNGNIKPAVKTEDRGDVLINQESRKEGNYVHD
jgi:hypothetical protein